MKKWMAFAVAVLLTGALAQAQQIRTCYRSGEISHISTEYEALSFPGDIPARIRVERAGFQDGTAVYVLYINLEQKEAFTAPKGVKLTASLPGGKFIRLDQMGQDSPTRKRLENGMFLNRFKYPVSEADMLRLRQNVTMLEIITGWGPDDNLQFPFPDNAFSALLERHCAKIGTVVGREEPLSAVLAGYSDNMNNVMATADALVGRGERFPYNIILSYLYYKNTDGEDCDLAFLIGTEEKHHIPYDAPVSFTLRDGSAISLVQTRDEENFVYLFPSMEELYRMAFVGIAAISITTEDGKVEDRFPDGADDFSASVRRQLQLLLSVSPR